MITPNRDCFSSLNKTLGRGIFYIIKIFISLAISATGVSLSLCRVFNSCICFSVNDLGRPPCRTLALSASNPALVRSFIMSFSNSANEANI